MKNTLKIFRADLLRIRKNVIAWIVILGIIVVPSLYAWFNIAASWDPYENTDKLMVAVASVDKGYTGTLLPVSMNLGDDVLSALRENTQLDWIFTSRAKAVSGVESGKYYAAIVIPEDFSQNLMSLFSSNVTNPDITYYSNAKENAIAPKVTEKGASAIQAEVKEVFIKTISSTAISAMQTVAETAGTQSTVSLASTLIENLEKTSAELSSASGTIHAFASIADSTQQMLETSSQFITQTRTQSDSFISSMETSADSFDNVKGLIFGATDGINQALTESGSYYEQIAAAIEGALSSLSTDSSTVADTLSSLATEMDKMITSYERVRDAIEKLGEEYPEFAPFTGPIVGKLDESIEVQKSLRDRLNSTADSMRSQSADNAADEEALKNLIDENAKSLANVKADYEQNVKSRLNNLFDSIGKSKNSVSGLFSRLEESATGIDALTGSASSGLVKIKDTLTTSENLLKKASARLTATVNQLKLAQENGDFESLENIISGDKENISSFLSSPVSLDTQKLYPIANYGSSMAPFYSTLAIWVGGVILVAMLNVSVSASSLAGLSRVKNSQTYLGRFMLFLAIGLMQSGLICLGDLFYLKIQCPHPFLFLLAGWLTSVIYVNIIYTLTVSFGDIGKAISVVLLVMQVAGSGGTFPIEVAPEFFRRVYPLLPFTHSMAAMRECIGGMYGFTYIKELGILTVFLLVSLLLGLLLRKPIIKMNESFMGKLESTHLM